ncbi:unnamed protein product [Miscanthus lutarioriparius]|uniref:KIB1-4 beta-propeller domain-containing protein n=1 Tax=Miscanthus lutarioriparius TaxID=422564 RepID=A0A811RKZ1_9POAL|nr:unnamed protein product [Miscanthus lutarioriparius]
MPLCSYGEHVETVNVPDDETTVTWMDIKDLTEISVITLIMCSKHLIAAIVAISGLGTIALCRPGDAAWSVSAHEQCMWLSDMVFFQGKLYAIDTNEDLSIDIVDELDNDRPRVSHIDRIIEGETQPPQSYPKSMLCLFESHGTLLMVRWTSCEQQRNTFRSLGNPYDASMLMDLCFPELTAKKKESLKHVICEPFDMDWVIDSLGSFFV